MNNQMSEKTQSLKKKKRKNCICGNGKQLSRASQDQRRYENKVEMKIVIFGAGEVVDKIDATKEKRKTGTRNAVCGRSAGR